MTRFDLCLAETLTWEGGWSDDPVDPGGPTMKGIIQRVYDGWRDGHGLTRRTVRAIEESELRDIYWHNYWLQVHAEQLPPGVDLAVFDFAVNSGPPRAVRHLQRALGVSEDGHLGPATLAAVAAAEPGALVRRVMASRRAFLRQPRRGASVANVSPAVARDLVEVRATLEGLNARLAARHHEDAIVAELRRVTPAAQQGLIEEIGRAHV